MTTHSKSNECTECFQEAEVYPCTHCDELICLDCAVKMTVMNQVDYHVCETCYGNLE